MAYIPACQSDLPCKYLHPESMCLLKGVPEAWKSANMGYLAWQG